MAKDLDAIAKQIIELQIEHRDLDDVITRLCATPVQDELQIRRLKKRKLQIKDQITWLQIQLTPDIPA
ncbi:MULTISPECIES: YdcH family protein [Derxia]|uniref:YdcH family protein n=1 Tax=Derxia gummosa DSM 723 TaxID=1121388 RepID=A0A8B6XAM8_9BURK|nr:MULTISPECIES: YdcH family protein [Derxia]